VDGKEEMANHDMLYFVRPLQKKIPTFRRQIFIPPFKHPAMPATFKNCLLLVITVLYFSSAPAQKVAHCNYDSLMKGMPESKTADSLLQVFTYPISQQVSKMQKEIDSLNNKFNANRQVWSEAVLIQKQKEIDGKIRQRQIFQQESQLNITVRQQELTMQVRKKLMLAISLVAKQEGYAYILNSAVDNNQVLYFDPSHNVSQKIKSRMDYMQPAWVH
jgi:outer membrane protein